VSPIPSAVVDAYVGTAAPKHTCLRSLLAPLLEARQTSLMVASLRAREFFMFKEEDHHFTDIYIYTYMYTCIYIPI